MKFVSVDTSKHYKFDGKYYICSHCGDNFAEKWAVVMHCVTDHIKKKSKVKRGKKEDHPNLLPLKGVQDGRFIP